MILLWGLPEDGPLQAVQAALLVRDEPFALLDQRQSREIRVESVSRCGIPEVIRAGERRIDLTEVTAAYLRPYEPECFLPRAARRPAASDGRMARRFIESLWCWAELSPALVLNRPAAMAANGSKPWQAALIGTHGFRTPATLVTNDASAAGRFWAEHGAVIYKSISGQRSTVTRLSRHSSPRWSRLRWCPTQFQRYIPGTDVRVHVVGAEVFASAIHCQADDYRYPKGSARCIEAVDIPEDCRARCVALARGLGLSLAGIDLRRTPDGDWFCFEVNPSPAFTFYQDATGQPIDTAIARHLIEGVRGGVMAGPGSWTNSPAVRAEDLPW